MHPLNKCTMHIFVRICIRFTCTRTHTHTRVACTRTCALDMFVCMLLKTGFFVQPGATPFFLRDLSPQLGDMVETLVALSGVIGSGHRRLPQAADTLLDQTEEVKGKPGSGKSSGPIPVDYHEIYCLYYFVWFVLCLPLLFVIRKFDTLKACKLCAILYNLCVSVLNAAKVGFEMLSSVSCVCCDILRFSQKKSANVKCDIKCDVFLNVLCQCALRLRKRRFQRIRAVRQSHYRKVKEGRRAHGEAEVFFS